MYKQSGFQKKTGYCQWRVFVCYRHRATTPLVAKEIHWFAIQAPFPAKDISPMNIGEWIPNK